MKNRIRMRHLRCFLELSAHRSVTQAAVALNTVQPSVSRTLKELETEAGAVLFQRSSQGLTLTPAGETLLSYVKGGVFQIDQGLSVLRGEQADQRVSIHALPTVARVLMPDVICKFREFYPDIDLRIRTPYGPDPLEELRSGQLDFIFGRLGSPTSMSGMSFEHLYHEPILFLTRLGHPLANKSDVQIEDINQYEVILSDLDIIIRTEIDHFIHSKGLTRFDKLIETLSFDFARIYIQKSDSIGCLPKGAILQEVAEGQLCVLDIHSDGLIGAVGLTTLAGKTLSHPASLMQEVIRNEVIGQGLL